MGDITNPKLIHLKDFLFLFAGLLASAILLVEHPSLRVALQLGLSIWCFARFHDFAFYVIEHYVDDEYKFAGLFSSFVYLVRRRGKDDTNNVPPPS